jgi:small neutral amino acid transporter SnatA (MarC family)
MEFPAMIAVCVKAAEYVPKVRTVVFLSTFQPVGRVAVALVPMVKPSVMLPPVLILMAELKEKTTMNISKKNILFVITLHLTFFYCI